MYRFFLGWLDTSKIYRLLFAFRASMPKREIWGY